MEPDEPAPLQEPAGLKEPESLDEFPPLPEESDLLEELKSLRIEKNNRRNGRKKKAVRLGQLIFEEEDSDAPLKQRKRMKRRSPDFVLFLRKAKERISLLSPKC